MDQKKNCWEVKDCGRGPDSECNNGDEICPAARPNETDGINGGIHSGRFCWAVAGTYCGDKVQGIFAEKIESCVQCQFFHMVEKEEEENFILHTDQSFSEENLEEESEYF